MKNPEMLRLVPDDIKTDKCVRMQFRSCHL